MSNNPQPQLLESFYPQLAKNKEAKANVKSTFGKDTKRILESMIAGTLTTEEDLTIDGVLTDLVHNGYDEETFYGQGDCGYFPISIRGVKSVYFIQASEFDDIGYFSSVKEARAFAETEYESYRPFVEDPDDEEEDEDEWDDEEE
jgi:hypothetical protein